MANIFMYKNTYTDRQTDRQTDIIRSNWFIKRPLLSYRDNYVIGEK